MAALAHSSVLKLSLLCLLLGSASCAEDSKSKSPEKDISQAAVPKETLAAIQKALIEDAAVDKISLIKLAQRDTPPSPEDIASHNLSVMLCFMAQPWNLDQSPDKLDQDLELDSEFPPPPTEYFEGLMKNRVGEKFCVMTPEGIKELTCKIEANQATGTVKFRFAEIFTANVHYTAELKDGAWRATKFWLPAWDIKIDRQQNQNWLASGMGLTVPYVNLPRVDGVPARNPTAPRLKINIGLKSSSRFDPSPPDDLVVIEYNPFAKTKLEDFQMKLPELIKAFEKEHATTAKKMSLVIWADHRAEWGKIEKFLQAAMELGVRDIRLVADSKNPLHRPKEMHSIGVFTVRVEDSFDDNPDIVPAFQQTLKIYADPKGQIKSINFESDSLAEDQILAKVKSFAESSKNPLDLELHADPKLLYGKLHQVLSKCGELKETPNSKLKTFVPFYKTLQMKNPKAAPEVELELQPVLPAK